jgi:DNA polymerase III subunit delta
MTKPRNALDFLAGQGRDVPPLCVLFGDEPFLKRLVLERVRECTLKGGDAEFSLSRFDGATAELRSVQDELTTVAMFGGRRLAVVDDADEFVTRYRAQLEAYAAAPRPGGVLVLDVKTWPANTRLAKIVAEHHLAIECKASAAGLVRWVVEWARQKHAAKIEHSAAELLVEVTSGDLGLVDQHLAKLALLAEAGAPITAALVDEHVVGWRTRTAWEMIDAAAGGNAAEALLQLDRLLRAGEQPIALLGQIASTLRRFAATTRLVQQAERDGRRPAIRQVLEQAGFKSFVLGKAQEQLLQIGRVRGAQLLRWLLEADLALKGSSSSPPRARLVLEELIVRLSRGARPAVRR